MSALGFSLFLIAVGAILIWAIGVSTVGPVSVFAVGAILFSVGVLGAVLAMLFWTSFAPFRTRKVHEDVHIR